MSSLGEEKDTLPNAGDHKPKAKVRFPAELMAQKKLVPYEKKPQARNSRITLRSNEIDRELFDCKQNLDTVITDCNTRQ